MPDIQTALKSALSKTLQDWDDEGETPSVQPVSASFSQPTTPTQGIPMTQAFSITNNVSRVTFDYIRTNPGSTRKEIITALEHKNFRPDSVSSLIAQMRRNKLIHEKDGLYYADADEYRPLKSLKAIKKMEAKAAPVEVRQKRKYTKRSEGIGALLQAKIESAPAPVATAPLERKSFLTKLVRTQSPESIVENMNVLQARELYDYLRKIFGG